MSRPLGDYLLECDKIMQGLGAGLAGGSMASELDDLPQLPDGNALPGSTQQTPFRRGLKIGALIVIGFWLFVFLLLLVGYLIFH